MHIPQRTRFQLMIQTKNKSSQNQTKTKSTQNTPNETKKQKYVTKGLEANSSRLVNWSFENDLFSLAHRLNVMLQSLAIDSEYSPIAWVLDLNSTVGKILFHYKWTSPP